MAQKGTERSKAFHTVLFTYLLDFVFDLDHEWTDDIIEVVHPY